MLDDFDSAICSTKHYGPVLYMDGGEVIRCSFCEELVRSPMTAIHENEPKKRSSKTCIQVCDWVTDDKMGKCKSCGYTGPLP